MFSALGDSAATASAWVLLIQDVATSLLSSWQTSGYNANRKQSGRRREYVVLNYVCSFFQLTAVRRKVRPASSRIHQLFTGLCRCGENLNHNFGVGIKFLDCWSTHSFRLTVG